MEGITIRSRESSPTRQTSQIRESSPTRESSSTRESSPTRKVPEHKGFYELRRFCLQREALFGSSIFEMSWASIPWAPDSQDLKAWRNPTEPCTSPTCPVNYLTKTSHSVGRYLHNGECASRKFGLHSFLFGSCNPPPELLDACERLEDQDYGGDDDREIKDMHLIRDFLVHHVKFLLIEESEADGHQSGCLSMGWGRVG